jgi:N-acetylglucosaminyldiphosphoundecaprenol N-acetyl-beta-D-mannosaminyltransferase
VAGYYSPPFNALLEMDHDEIKRQISDAKPDLLFVAFGCPKAEKWIAMHYRELGVAVAIGVGATIDFLAGQVKRAPVWMRRSGLEWVFRLVQEPRRLFGRYAKDLWVFGWSLVAQWWCLRPGNNARSAGTFLRGEQAAGSDHQLIRFSGSLDGNAGPLIETVIADGRPCIFDLSQLALIDSTGIALLMRLQQRLYANGSPLVLLGVSTRLKRIFKRMRWDDFFTCAAELSTAVRLLQARGQEREAVVDGVSRLVWRGEITAANIAGVWTRTQKFLLSASGVQSGTSGCNTLIIDLSQVRFIDSSGLGLMIRSRKLAQREGLGLMFTGAQPAVRSVVRMARLEQFLNMAPGNGMASMDSGLVPEPV